MEFNKIVRLKDIAEVEMGQSPKSEFYNEQEGTPFLQGTRTFGLLYPIIDTYTTKVTKWAIEGDILFSVRAPVGDINIATIPLCIGRGLAAVRSKTNNQKFLFYLLKAFNNYEGHSTGTIFSSINKSTLENLEFAIPEENIQSSIGDFLWSIDEKIELNNNIISNLEQLSQTLFKHWFIDFEFPNEEGKPYKSSGGEMVESELGEIPKGWEILKLSDITTLLKKTFNPSKTEVTEVLHFSLPAFDKNQLPTLDEVSTIKSNKWIIEENCVVFSKMNPKTPRIWLTNINEKMINVASSEFVVLQSKTVEENSFIYSLCKSNSFNEYLISNATGSTNSRQRVTPTIALSYKFPLSREIMKLYGSTIVGISEKIKDLYKECETLQQLRDTLLPKLLSGEIEIPDDLEV